MENTLPFSNWSLKKTLNSVPDLLVKAQIKVFYYIYLLNIAKVVVILPYHITKTDSFLILGDFRVIVVSLILLKILLAKPQYIKQLVHIATINVNYSIWLTTFWYHQGDTVIILQYIFMAILFSFYGLGRNWGYFYSILSTLPIILYPLLKPYLPAGASVIKYDIDSVEYLVVISLHFFAIILTHYYFYNTYYKTIEEKEILNENLKKAAHDKSIFLSTMSHELRTPLNSVIGMADLLLDNKPNDDQKENLNVLKFSAESLLALINDILDFNKIESSKIELESIPFNLAHLLENSCAGFRIKATEKKLDFNLIVDPDLFRQNVSGDPTRFVQIIYNLVGNALKFTQQGKIEISAHVIGKEHDFIRVMFSISDTGIGINSEKLDLIFEPFTQASHTIMREFGGTGLGLAIVKHLLTLYGSSIHLESEVNKGTRFYFAINFKITNLTVTRDSYGSISEKIGLDNLRVLVAEDNAMSVIFMRKLLSKWKVNYTIVGDGQQVVDMISQNEYDVVLMDMHMPIMNGYEATLLIRQMVDRQKSSIPIIALTASVSDKTVSKFKEHGMTDYLSKPFKPAELHYRLAKIQAEKG